MKSWNLDRLRHHPAYWYVVYGCVLVVAVVFLFEVRHLWGSYVCGAPGTSDYVEYWTAGQLLLTGQNPYDFHKLHELQGELGSPYKLMWNPPWLLIWLYPLLCLPFLTSALTWMLVSGVLVLVSAALVWRTFTSPDERMPLGIAWVASCLFLPALMTLRMGQMSSVILLGVAGFLYFAARRKDCLAGMFLALTTVKPHVVYLVWILVAWSVVTERRWKTIAGLAAVFLPTFLALTLVRPDWFAEYRTAAADPPLYWQTPTLGCLLRLFVFTEEDRAQFFPTLVVGSLVVAYLLIKRPVVNWKKALGPVLLLSLPTASYGWAFDQLVLLVPYLAVVSWMFRDGALLVKEKVVAAAVLLGISGIMLAQNQAGAQETYFVWVPGALAVVYLYAHSPWRTVPEVSYA